MDNVLFIAIIALYLVAAKYGSAWLKRFGAIHPTLAFVSLSVAIPATIMCLMAVLNTPGVLNKFGVLALFSIPLFACWGFVCMAVNIKLWSNQ